MIDILCLKRIKPLSPVSREMKCVHPGNGTYLNKCGQKWIFGLIAPNCHKPFTEVELSPLPAVLGITSHVWISCHLLQLPVYTYCKSRMLLHDETSKFGTFEKPAKRLAAKVNRRNMLIKVAHNHKIHRFTRQQITLILQTVLITDSIQIVSR